MRTLATICRTTILLLTAFVFTDVHVFGDMTAGRPFCSQKEKKLQLLIDASENDKIVASTNIAELLCNFYRSTRSIIEIPFLYDVELSEAKIIF